MKRVSKEELGKGDGSGGEPTLVAVDGKVYDVGESGMWAGGTHMNAHTAGRDLSAEIKAAPHSTDVLERFEQVGELSGEEARKVEQPAFPKPSALVSAILSRHPHPVSVHFPIALSIAGAIFTALGLAVHSETLEAAGFYNLVLGAVMSPPAIGAGLLSWWYNYGRTWTPIFRKKILLSVLYLAVAASAIAVRLVLPVDEGTTWYWIYAALVIALPAVAMALGFLGGKITFPS